VPALVDGYLYYGAAQPLWAVGNFLSYNALGQGGGGQGANLYGEEPWSFYPKNLLLNFNLVALLGLGSLLTLVVLPGERERRKHACLSLSGMYLTIGVLQPMAHKEERFLTMVYPTLCLGAALTLDALLTAVSGGVAAAARGAAAKRPGLLRRLLGLVVRLGVAVAVLGFILLCAARSAALVQNHGAPFAVYAALPEGATNVCVGKEWYRFPASFFLPASAPPLLYIRGGFTGQLPQPYAEWPRGHSATPEHMNDRNAEEPSRYVGLGACNYVIDLDLEGQTEPSVVRDGAWEKVKCAPFLDAGRSTSTLARAFYVPRLSARKNVYAPYCLMARRRR